MNSIFGCIQNDGTISFEKGGRVVCMVCGSTMGLYARNYIRKDNKGNTFLKLFKRCANCHSLEVTNNWTGEILKQEVKNERIKKLI